MPKVIDVETLFEATLSVFVERGYGAATTQEIARRAGVNEVTIFRRYGSKAGLIAAALTQRLARAPFARFVATDDVRTDLASIASAYVATNAAHGAAVVTLFSEMPRHPELRRAASVLVANLRDAAQVILVHQARGNIGPGDPMRKLAFLIAPLLAAGLWGRGGVGEIDTDLDPGTVVDAFLDGHRAR